MSAQAEAGMQEGEDDLDDGVVGMLDVIDPQVSTGGCNSSSVETPLGQCRNFNLDIGLPRCLFDPSLERQYKPS